MSYFGTLNRRVPGHSTVGTQALQVPGARTLVMQREFSAGGVVVRTIDGRPHVAVIRPRGKDGVWALPKGKIDPGESAAETAVREVREETGIEGRLVEKLGDIRYVYMWK